MMTSKTIRRRQATGATRRARGKRAVRFFAVLLTMCGAFGQANVASANSQAKDVTCTIEGSLEASVAWVGGNGTYRFRGSGLGIDCVIVVGQTADGVAEAALAEVDFESAGLFDSYVCGTGTAADDDPTIMGVTTTPDSPNVEATLHGADLGYHVTFAGGEGVLTWGDNAIPNNPDPNHPLSGADVSTAPVGGGVISITPWRGRNDPRGDQQGTFPGDPPNGNCTNGFNVEGVVSGQLAG